MSENSKYLCPWEGYSYEGQGIIAVTIEDYVRYLAFPINSRHTVSEVAFRTSLGAWMYFFYDLDMNIVSSGDRTFLNVHQAMQACDIQLVKYGYEFVSQERINKLSIIG